MERKRSKRIGWLEGTRRRGTRESWRELGVGGNRRAGGNEEQGNTVELEGRRSRRKQDVKVLVCHYDMITRCGGHKRAIGNKVQREHGEMEGTRCRRTQESWRE